MNKLTLLKRMFFWVEVAGTFVILCFGLFLTVRLLSGANDILGSVLGLVEFSGYLIKTAIELVPRVPGVAFLSVFWFSLYVGSLFYFAQTNTDKKALKYVIPSSLAAILFCSIGVFGAALAGLASQGAGH